MSSAPKYVLGTDDPEIARLDAQAGTIAPATDLLLRAGGIGGSMRVLDLGCGLGHVSFQTAALLDGDGSVVGVDEAAPLLEVAERRRAADGRSNVRFVRGDARTYRDDEPFDAIVTRLLLFHLPDAVDVLRHQLGGLSPGGLVLAIDFDLGTARSEPPIPLAATALAWVEAAFRSAGANPRIGAQLGQLLRAAGVADVTTLGVQSYLAPDDPRAPRLLGGVVRSLAPQMVSAGIATEAELGLDTLEGRIADQLTAAEAVLLPPAVVGAWGRRASSGRA
jgi:SAM-dependent methyltransferase